VSPRCFRVFAYYPYNEGVTHVFGFYTENFQERKEVRLTNRLCNAQNIDDDQIRTEMEQRMKNRLNDMDNGGNNANDNGNNGTGNNKQPGNGGNQ